MEKVLELKDNVREVTAKRLFCVVNVLYCQCCVAKAALSDYTFLMRLTDHEALIIIKAFQSNFGNMDHLWLFGSRADDAKRGGDIDLYVETQETDMDRLYDKKVRFVSDMWNQMGEQKIDVIINALFNPTSLPIYKIAKETGILLV